MKPLDTAIYWAEYVIRHQGAKHIQSPTKIQSMTVTSSMDVMILSIVLILVSYKLGSSFLIILIRNLMEKYGSKAESTDKKTK